MFVYISFLNVKFKTGSFQYRQFELCVEIAVGTVRGAALCIKTSVCARAISEACIEYA